VIMRDYRLYALDSLGLIDRPAKIDRFANDRSAIIAAEMLRHRHTVEVWEGVRWVANVAANA
jgi:hypothetical protein